MKRVTFTAPQRALLQQLVQCWQEQSRAASEEAERTGSGATAQLLERRAQHLRCCAAELQNAVEKGDLPAQLGYQILVV